MSPPRGVVRLSWWLILLLLWLAPAVLASLGMLWSGWVRPALVRPRKRVPPEIARDLPPQICLPAEPADGETAAGDRLHRAVPSPGPPPAPGTLRTPDGPSVEHAGTGTEG